MLSHTSSVRKEKCVTIIIFSSIQFSVSQYSVLKFEENMKILFLPDRIAFMGHLNSCWEYLIRQHKTSSRFSFFRWTEQTDVLWYMNIISKLQSTYSQFQQLTINYVKTVPLAEDIMPWKFDLLKLIFWIK